MFGTDRSFLKRENLVISDKDPLDLVELKQILTSMYDKIEDTLVQKSQKDIFLKEKQDMKNDLSETFKPSTINSSQPVLNLGSFGNATKVNPEGIKNLGAFGSASKASNKSEEDFNSTAEKESEVKSMPIIKRKLEQGAFPLENESEGLKRIKPE